MEASHFILSSQNQILDNARGATNVRQNPNSEGEPR